MHARTLLFKQLQQFFEMYLAPRWRIQDVIFSEPEMAPKERGIRQRSREIVMGHFGPFTLSIYSTVEEPPLGKITLTVLDGSFVQGAIDERTWREIAALIKSHERVSENVDG
jgi:hypothetical protein